MKIFFEARSTVFSICRLACFAWRRLRFRLDPSSALLHNSCVFRLSAASTEHLTQVGIIG